jgi:hypothetical protein
LSSELQILGLMPKFYEVTQKIFSDNLIYPELDLFPYILSGARDIKFTLIVFSALMDHLQVSHMTP